MMTFKLYLLLEFCSAFATAGIMGTCFVFNSEWSTAKYRVYLNAIALMWDTMPTVGVGLAGWYFEDNFAGYKLALAVPGFFMIIAYAAIRESPQWLLAKHKYKPAIDSMKLAGRINGRPPHKKLLEQIQVESICSSLGQPVRGQEVPKTELRNQAIVRSVFAQKCLVLRLAIMSSVWFSALCGFYGVVLASKDVHHHKYTGFVITGLAEIPGTLLATVLLDRIGRRRTIAASLFICGLMLIMSTCTPVGYARMILILVGRAAVKGAMIGLGTYTAELWPTAARNTLFSLSALCGRLGGIVASVSVLLTVYSVHLPLILNGSSAMIASVLLMCLLPETLNTKLPDTVDEAIEIGKKAAKISANDRASADDVE